MSQSDKKTKNRPTKKQISKLIDYMKQHIAFVRGEVDDVVSAIAWQQLTTDLNTSGVVRDMKIWQKTWSDLQRMAEQRMHALNTGARTIPLTDEDITVLGIVQSQQQRDIKLRARSPLNCQESSNDGLLPKFCNQKRTQVTKRPALKSACIDLTDEADNADFMSVTGKLNQQHLNPSKATASTSGAVHRQPPRPAPGVNTSLISAINDQSTAMKDIVQKLLSCFEAQNEILQRGFTEVAKKLSSAMRETILENNVIEDSEELAEAGYEETVDGPDIKPMYKLNCAHYEDDEEEEEFDYKDVQRLTSRYAEDNSDLE